MEGDVTGEQCQQKWINLQEGLEYYQHQADMSGTIPSWSFFTRLRTITSFFDIPSDGKCGFTDFAVII